MKKYLYLLVFLALQFSIRAQDTVSPFTTFGYPVYGHDSMISFLGGVIVGGFGFSANGFPDDCDGIINHYLKFYELFINNETICVSGSINGFPKNSTILDA